jgi:hypothetical protein
MEAEKTLDLKEENTMIQAESIVDTNFKRYECPICGMDEWCGTDGCPMDPQ